MRLVVKDTEKDFRYFFGVADIAIRQYKELYERNKKF